ncbi:PREDICTED: afadin-like [Priapulus caudatus]|uniref:Afadin-like n=1 Tax=Priapulus caudatus TaxID=37621 RepID=A0ABM1F573_PRICU|nr:PREDICTED: afadin-like [Priapulus caudatus]
MRMLDLPEYSLYEVHVSGEERKLGARAFPLFVQLNWSKDDREGRFLLKREGDKPISAKEAIKEQSDLNRRLSKRESKKKKKREKEADRNKQNKPEEPKPEEKVRRRDDGAVSP